MSFDHLALGPWLRTLGWAVALSLLALAASRARAARRPLFVQGAAQHALFGFVALAAFVWAMHAPMRGGVALHLVGAGLASAMFGWPVALLALAAASVVHRVLADAGGPWTSIGFDYAFGAALPALLAAGTQAAIRRWLPRNPIVFMLGNGFFASGLSLAAATAATSVLLVAADAVPSRVAFGELLPFGLLLGWGEAFLSGLLLSVFVVYRPAWVPAFDDTEYLRAPPN